MFKILILPLLVSSNSIASAHTASTTEFTITEIGHLLSSPSHFGIISVALLGISLALMVLKKEPTNKAAKV
jgi:hypothetical protein